MLKKLLLGSVMALGFAGSASAETVSILIEGVPDTEYVKALVPEFTKETGIKVIYDTFDVGRGPEYEFAQVTVPANASIAPITDRMPLILSEEDIELWLGELRAPIEDVKDLIRTREFDPAEWNIGPEDPDKKPPRPRKKRRSEIDRPDLFPKR